MACFIVPAAEAIVTTALRHHVNKVEAPAAAAACETPGEEKITWKRKLTWLNNMLWGGAALLMLEHIWHGEVIFAPPFLTAMRSAADTQAMLHEMATVGIGMAVLVTVVWGAMILVADRVPGLRRRLVAEGSGK
ncbi:MAG: hypothetical protein LBR14_01520 [Clostridiales Family XIII bacterium]|jgi:hypothetical protein|nr:hypothetical protein [Clostridiales Family XIII bacterium]